MELGISAALSAGASGLANDSLAYTNLHLVPSVWDGSLRPAAIAVEPGRFSFNREKPSQKALRWDNSGPYESPSVTDLMAILCLRNRPPRWPALPGGVPRRNQCQ